MLYSAETVTEHLHDVGNRFIPKPFTYRAIPVMDLDEQGEAERF